MSYNLNYMSKQLIKHSLNEAEFRSLISRKTVTITREIDITVKLILQDIGWDRMIQIIEEEQKK